MLIMAEVTSEMGAELRAAALANKTSVAAEVGRRLERLARLEAEVGGRPVRVVPVNAGFKPAPTDPVLEQRRAEFSADLVKRSKELGAYISDKRTGRSESLYSGPPNPWDMFRSTGGGR